MTGVFDIINVAAQKLQSCLSSLRLCGNENIPSELPVVAVHPCFSININIHCFNLNNAGSFYDYDTMTYELPTDVI